jgi:hypothetical protein
VLDVPVQILRLPQGSVGKWGAETTVKANWLTLHCQEKSPFGALSVPVPQPDTGRQGEHPKAFERTPVKELGKLAP